MAQLAHNCEVLVAGEFYCDLIFAGLDGAPALGREQFAAGLSVVPGGAYNFALGLKRLGVDTRWICDFGSDPFSRLVLDRARRDGLNDAAFTLRDEPVHRVSVAFAAEGERGFISCCAPPVAPPPRVLAEAQAPSWLLQSFRCEPEWLDFVAAARSRGARVLGDCRGGDFSLEMPEVRALVQSFDVFAPNADEARSLTGKADLEDAARALLRLCPLVAIKDGAAGALVATGARLERIAGHRVEVVDTVGAGDAFIAGFLFGLVHGCGPVRCTELGNLCGACSVTFAGGGAGPDGAALLRFAAMNGLEIDPGLADLLATGPAGRDAAVQAARSMEEERE